MARPPRSKKQDRLFVREPFRHYRRSYSLTEVKWGAGVGAVLVAIAAWVMWRGAHPDPALFASAPLRSSNKQTVVERQPLAVSRTPGATATAKADANRAPLPDNLTADGWHEGPTSQYTRKNLYVKIDGRADYFLQYGFERLYFLTLAYKTGDGTTVDIEAYDLGSAANALGAFSGERKPDDKPSKLGGGLLFRSRNALFITRGSLYIRAIGSDDKAAVSAELDHLAAAFGAPTKQQKKPDTRLPWAYRLFDKLGIATGKIAYLPDQAFSFDFGKDMYAARLDHDSQLFIIAHKDAAAAKANAKQFVDGFASLGSKTGGGWAKDRYLNTFATATVANDRFVIGVRGAPTLAKGKAQLARLRATLAGLSDAERAEAQPTARKPTPTEDESDPGSGAPEDMQ